MAQDLSAPVVIKGGGGKNIFLFESDVQIIGPGTSTKPPGLFLGTSKAEGGGHQGRFFLWSLSGNEGIALKGDGTLVMRDHTGKIVFNFDSEANMAGKPAGLWLGSSKEDGGGPSLLVMRNAAGEDGIVLDGSNGFTVRDHAGKVVFNFAGEANMTGKPAGLWLGRAKGEGGGPSLLVMRNAAGEDNIALDGATGSISAGLGKDQGGAFSLRNAVGNEIFRIDYFTVDTIHALEQHGRVRIKNTNGADTITLDGRNGDITLNNADCAEDFDIAESAEVEPGTVVVIDEEGRLRPSREPYDKKVAGVISGAGNCRPGIILDKNGLQPGRLPVALIGKVYCKADAGPAGIATGDLLTTSALAGHAMKASDPVKAFGAVIGKALRPLRTGNGLIPILIALQ